MFSRFGQSQCRFRPETWLDEPPKKQPEQLPKQPDANSALPGVLRKRHDRKMARATAEDLEEERGQTKPAQAIPQPAIQSNNAFAELMRPKPAQPKQQSSGKKVDSRTKQTTFFGRDGLAAYTEDPASFPQSRVADYNDRFVIINDLYPKATVHLLILCRDPKKNVLRGQEAFDDPQFLADCQREEERVRGMVADELRRKLGKHSAAESARNEALESDDPPDDLPPGRDWSKEIISGTHANPSMNHLHIHVLSRDMHSECMKKKNHYLSFTTDFLIPMDAYPLAKDDFRRDYRHFTEPEMKCWRCGKDFGNKMVQLKDHLDREFDEWRKE